MIPLEERLGYGVMGSWGDQGLTLIILRAWLFPVRNPLSGAQVEDERKHCPDPQHNEGQILMAGDRTGEGDRKTEGNNIQNRHPYSPSTFTHTQNLP